MWGKELWGFCPWWNFVALVLTIQGIVFVWGPLIGWLVLYYCYLGYLNQTLLLLLLLLYRLSIWDFRLRHDVQINFKLCSPATALLWSGTHVQKPAKDTCHIPAPLSAIMLKMTRVITCVVMWHYVWRLESWQIEVILRWQGKAIETAES